MSAEPTGMIFDIQSYSVHDGPGCRTNVFFTGCPLKCRWCANPESWRPKLQFMFADRVCKWDQGCKACRDACPHGSIQFDENGKPSVDWKICNDCETIECTTSCAAGALKQTVRIMTVSDLVNTLRRDYNNWGSDGGVTFTGGEPTLRHDLVKLVQAAQWFVTRLNTNGRMLTSMMCKELHEASLDAVQITFYSADADIHNELVGVDGYNDTLNGIKNALAAGLNVSLNTPLCSLNRDYLSTVKLAHELGIRYLTCSGLIPAGNAETAASRAVRLTPEELEATLRPAMEYAAANGLEINFTSPGWLSEDTLRGLGFTQIPSCGACLSNMAIAPDGTVLPCQSWLTGKGLGNLLRTPWQRIWRSDECRAIRGQSAKMERRCQLGETPMQEGC